MPKNDIPGTLPVPQHVWHQICHPSQVRAAGPATAKSADTTICPTEWKKRVEQFRARNLG